MPGKTGLRLAALLLLAGLAPAMDAGTAGAALPAEASLSTRLARALDRQHLPASGTSALAIDLDDGTVAFQRNATAPLRPASNEKLTLALAALDELGPDFRIATVVLGDGARDGSTWRGDLVLKGFGDPSLHADDLAALAVQVRALGIRRVTGRVLGDESFFDERRTAPGWKASYYKYECPPLSALVVDRAWLDGRTADEPAHAAAIAFRRTLARQGVKVAGKAAEGVAAAGAAELARVLSPRLSRLVDWMNTESDNLVAELLLKQLGAHELGQGTTAAGARIVRRELAERGVPLAGVRIVDGSGLSLRDRLTARALGALLVSARDDPRIGKPFLASLAVAGANGTLEDRMESGPAKGTVRAKTGTTSGASALSGYAGSDWAFVVLVNGNPVPVDAARRAQDRFAQILAGAG